MIPFVETPAPFTLMVETWTAAAPLFVSVTCCVALLPTATFPKLTAAGFACSCPEPEEEPVPSKLITTVGFDESLLVMLTLPVAPPAAVG